MPHPLAWDESSLHAIPVVEPEVLPASDVPVPSKTLASDEHGNGHGTGSAVTLAKHVAPKIVRRLIELALKSPNHAAARASGRDVLQLAGLLTETTKVDVVVSFRAIFQQMTADELQRFLTQHTFPERLRPEALKLLEP